MATRLCQRCLQTLVKSRLPCLWRREKTIGERLSLHRQGHRQERRAFVCRTEHRGKYGTVNTLRTQDKTKSRKPAVGKCDDVGQGAFLLWCCMAGVPAPSQPQNPAIRCSQVTLYPPANAINRGRNLEIYLGRTEYGGGMCLDADTPRDRRTAGERMCGASPRSIDAVPPVQGVRRHLYWIRSVRQLRVRCLERDDVYWRIPL